MLAAREEKSVPSNDTIVMAYPAKSARAIGCMLLGVGLLTFNDSLMKSLAGGYPVGQLLFLRGIFILPCIVLLALRDGGLGLLRVKNMSGQAVRASCFIISAFLFAKRFQFR